MPHWPLLQSPAVCLFIFHVCVGVQVCSCGHDSSVLHGPLLLGSVRSVGASHHIGVYVARVFECLVTHWRCESGLCDLCFCVSVCLCVSQFQVEQARLSTTWVTVLYLLAGSFILFSVSASHPDFLFLSSFPQKACSNLCHLQLDALSVIAVWPWDALMWTCFCLFPASDLTPLLFPCRSLLCILVLYLVKNQICFHCALFLQASFHST